MCKACIVAGLLPADEWSYCIYTVYIMQSETQQHVKCKKMLKLVDNYNNHIHRAAVHKYDYTCVQLVHNDSPR